MGTDSLKDAISDALAKNEKDNKKGGMARIIELTGGRRDQELLESRILDIGQTSRLNTIVLKINLIERSIRYVRLLRIKAGKLEKIWTLGFPRYDRSVKAAILQKTLDILGPNRSLIIIDFITLPENAKKLADYLHYMKTLFWLLRDANGGNDVFIIMREQEVRVFKEELERIVGGYEIIDNIS